MKAKFILPICAMLAACSSDGDKLVEEGSRSIELEPVEAQMLASCNSFGWDLFAEVQGEKDGNCVFSPLSAAIPLMMAANGAGPELQAKITEALGCQGSSAAQINSLYSKLTLQLPAVNSKSTLALANGGWAIDEASFLPEFSATVGQAYGADLRTARRGQAVSQVNDWCRTKTQGKITELVSDDNFDFLLISAAYFHSEWNKPFAAASTQTGTFANADGSLAAVPMMQQRDAFRYIAADGFSAAQLPYAGEGFSMYVALPAQGRSVGDCLAQIRAEGCESLSKRMSVHSLDLRMPKFAVESECTDELKHALSQKGLAPLFDSPDLSRMVDTAVDRVRMSQKCSIAVDEKGTEASASTELDGYRVEMQWPSATLALDRPFLFWISERSTGAVIFIGTVNAL